MCSASCNNSIPSSLAVVFVAVLLSVKGPKCDIGKHETDISAHSMIVLQYLLSQHAEHVKTADKQQVSDVSRFVSLPI